MKGEPAQIRLSNVRALGRHGADPGERDREQPFDIDVELDVDAERARHSDDLADTVDYALLHRSIVAVVASTSFALLERLAEEILVEVMNDGRVLAARVTVAKPQLLDGATPSVTLSRTRG